MAVGVSLGAVAKLALEAGALVVEGEVLVLAGGLLST